MKNRIRLIIKYSFLLLLIVGVVIVKLKSSFNSVEYYTLDGEVYYTKLNIGTYSGGNVVDLPIREGSVVKKNDLIVQLQNDILESKVKGYVENIKENIPYNRTDYFEQLKRVENLKIVSPVDGYVLEVNTAENGYLKDSDVVAVVVPLDTIKYSLVIDQNIKKNSTLELQEEFKVDQKVMVQNKLTKTRIDATIVDAVPFVKEGEPNNIKTRYIITADGGQSMQDSLGQEIEILFVKKTMITRVLDSINQLHNFVSLYLKK